MNEPIAQHRAGSAWRLYGLLDLASADGAGLDPGEKLDSRLREMLHPLALPPEFTAKVLASVSDAVAAAPVDKEQIRLSIFTPAPLPVHGKTWGFFRTLRNTGAPEPAGSRYDIAFYLYAEGLPGTA